MSISLHQEATQQLVQWAESLMGSPLSDFEVAQKLVRKLGAHQRNGLAEIGFWAPELLDHNLTNEQIFLEILDTPEELDLNAPQQELTWRRHRIPMVQTGEYVWAAIEGMTAGTREVIGSFYWLRYQDQDGEWQFITDYMAYSVPFGVKAPAEFYDWDAMQARRRDKAHFQKLDTHPDPDGFPRIQQPSNMLEVHPGTASKEGTLAGLTRIYQTIADKIENSIPLSADEHTYISYDAVQLMPVEPLIEHEAGPLFWEILEDDPQSDTLHVLHRQHDIFDWGYDVMIAASPAVNPAILSSKRPDELLDFIEVLHNFPGQPIKAMFDIVYGHTDNQALDVFPPQFLAGANMYGQNLNYLNPHTRAILLEMMRRKHNFGVDGVRVDGAQDFKWWEPQADTMIHDDEFLTLINNMVQEVAGQQYRPWMIFEDGRPWPRDDWELASTYREVTKQHPNVFQWGPLTFAHNTPFVFTFWIMKWWRIRELTQFGNRWITGTANHDTLRRGSQVDPKGKINTYLGATLNEIIQNAYDNPAGKLFDYVMMPGVPMDFLNASHRAPWGFIRNTDDKYSIKVVSEESRFSQWCIDEERFEDEKHFKSLKAMGFQTLQELRDFAFALDHVVQATQDGAPATIAAMLSEMLPPLHAGQSFSADFLKDYAKAWMADVNAYCNLSHYKADLDESRTAFFRQVREFRRERPWLCDNLRVDEYFDYIHPVDGSVVFYGLRRSPDNNESILFVANMEGAPLTVTPTKLPIPNLEQTGWQIALKSPDLQIVERATEAITFHNNQGIVFIRKQ